MNKLRNILRASLDEPVLFYGYRWFAWFIAAVSLALPGFQGNLALETWLLALTFMFNLMLTALAASYVRVARMRPALLIFDVLASVALVWASGGSVLPFLPYGLGSLVLPALLLPQIRSALPFASAFALLDQIAPFITPRDATTLEAAPDMVAVAVRVAAPFVFVLLANWVVVLARRAVRSIAPPTPGAAERQRRARLNATPGPTRDGLTTRGSLPPVMGRRSAEPAFDAPVAPPLAAISGSDREAQNMRRQIFALTPGIAADLPTALAQLATSFGRRSSISVRSLVVGTACGIPAAQHLTLLRLAQEALLNVQQHAHARTALITLRYEPHSLTLSVQDDGVGLLDGTHERPGMHALRAIAYRLAEIDGALVVFEGESGGVTVRGTAPL
ncbi:MAG: hypothetical protein H7Y32_19905 [Chloroflexales bacterium]|nr:hypothetical protein [Chloroflexales bacterium]